jgi:hypothetical protein
MTRNGKIARLPFKIREQVNRRLRDNVPGTKICEWVNRLPACKKVCEEFARRGGNMKSPVTVNQLSEWRRGGFQDWLREQRVLEESRGLREWCAKLARNGGDISEGAAVLMSGQLLKLVQGFGKLQASKRPSSREIPSSKLQNRIDDPCEHCAPGNGEVACLGGALTPESGTGTVPEPPGGDPSPSNFDATGACDTLPLAMDLPSRSGEMKEMESAVRLAWQLVRCLSGIRRGDHNRVRLEQAERKLTLRTKLVAIELEKYEKEKAEQEAVARKERAAELRRKRSPLSDEGKIDLVRGKLFGPDKVVAEREAELEEREKETKRLQKELEILKREMPPSRRKAKSNVQSHPNAEFGGVSQTCCKQFPSDDRCAVAQSRRSAECGAPTVQGDCAPEPAKAGTQNGESIRVDTS